MKVEKEETKKQEATAPTKETSKETVKEVKDPDTLTFEGTRSKIRK